jgi:alpha-tubulin suppressor-like RCC1 family protein
VLRPSDVVGSTSGVASATHFSASNQCITDTDGLLKCKGANSVGQIGIGTISLYESLKTVPGLNGTPSVAMGATHVCAVTAAGGAKCWGSNVSGKLGDSTMTNRSAPVDVIGLTSGVASISNASDHSCAVTTAGGVKCWGNNFFGKLGDGTNTERRTPVDVVGLTSGVAAVAVGGSHTCALTTGGGVKC